MSLVGHWEEAKFPAGINLVQTMAPGWRQIVSEVALDLITIPAVSALGDGGDADDLSPDSGVSAKADAPWSQTVTLHFF